MVEDAVPLEALRRALVVKLRHQGDVLLASPVFSALKGKAPHVEIDALVYAETAPMLAGHPSIGEVFCIERAWKTLGAFRAGERGVEAFLATARAAL
jgi:heptosyltransferase-3